MILMVMARFPFPDPYRPRTWSLIWRSLMVLSSGPYGLPVLLHGQYGYYAKFLISFIIISVSLNGTVNWPAGIIVCFLGGPQK
jgi:hypothetical protein